MQYRREIDGLRAVAVIPVMLFHAGIRGFPGGYVGVDVFFVISGYLITSILIEENEAGTFTLLGFYERRARRILPALFLVMTACLPFAWLWLMPADLYGFSQSLVAVSLFTSNVLYFLTSGYFATSAALKPLIHTWSLAIEEQFYLLFPLFLRLLWKAGRRWIGIILAIMATVSLVAADRTADAHPDFAFYLLPTRGWELLAGALIALHPVNSISTLHKPVLGQSLSVLGLVLIGYAVFQFNSQTPFPSRYALIPVLGAALIIIFASRETIVGALLGSKVLVGIGLISYSTYLWHQVMFAFARQHSAVAPGTWLLGGLAGAAVVLGFFSWQYVEKPFRNRQLVSRTQIAIFSAVGTACFVAIGWSGYFHQGFEDRLSSEQRSIAAYGRYDYREDYRDGRCFLGDHQDFSDYNASCRNVGAQAGALIWGDSHAAALAYGLRQRFPDLAQFTASGCPPVAAVVFGRQPECKGINDSILSEIGRTRPQRIFLHANWLAYKEQVLPQDVSLTIRAIQRASPASQILIVGSVPHWEPNLPADMINSHTQLDHPRRLRASFTGDSATLDEALRGVARQANVTFLSATEALCLGDNCQATIIYDGKLILTAWDDAHLTRGGSVWLASQFRLN
jgi:peptidoglycan/LPS O-acetylase OafA/YrhL